MKNFKKLAAFALAGCLTLSSMTVYAADATTAGGDGTTVTGSATIEDVDTDTPIFTVTLPTAANYDFTIDPDGLLSMDGETAKLEDLTNKGKIVFKNDDAFSYIKNKSSVPIFMQMAVKVTDDNTGSEVAVVSEATDGEYFTAKTNQMVIGVVPCKAEVTNVTNGTFATTDFVSSEKIVPVSSAAGTATDFGFYLDPATYVIKRAGTEGSYTYTYELDAVTENNFDATAFQLAGKVNPAADWSAYTAETTPKKIGISVVYKFLDASQVNAIGTELTSSKYVDGADAIVATLNETIPDGGATKLTGITVADYNTGIKTPIAISDLFPVVAPAEVAASIPESTTLSRAAKTLTIDIGSGTIGLKDADVANISKLEIINNGNYYDGLHANGELWADATTSITGTSLTVTFDEKYIAYYDVNEDRAVKVTYTNGNDEVIVLEGTITIAD